MYRERLLFLILPGVEFVPKVADLLLLTELYLVEVLQLLLLFNRVFLDLLGPFLEVEIQPTFARLFPFLLCEEGVEEGLLVCLRVLPGGVVLRYFIAQFHSPRKGLVLSRIFKSFFYNGSEEDLSNFLQVPRGLFDRLFRRFALSPHQAPE